MPVNEYFFEMALELHAYCYHPVSVAKGLQRVSALLDQATLNQVVAQYPNAIINNEPSISHKVYSRKIAL